MGTAKITSGQTGIDKTVEINKSETLALKLRIGEKDRKYKDAVQHRGNEIGLKIPVIIEQNKSSQATDYYFKFKYDSYQPESDKDAGFIN